MKITVIENNGNDSGSEPLSWYLIGDSAWTNAGKPFFIPEDTEIVTVSLAPVIRFNRLGKSVAEKFASRYYSEIAPGLHFRLPQIRERLTKEGLSWAPAVSFDRSLIVGNFGEFHQEEDFVLDLTINRESAVSFRLSQMKRSIDKIISEISRTNTIKMGDFLLPVLAFHLPVKQGDYLEVTGSFPSGLSVKVK